MRLEALNRVDADSAGAALARCCGSSRWVANMLALRPFHTAEALLKAADGVWRSLGAADWREAFASHPRIGETRPAGPSSPAGSDRAGSAAWAEAEQAGARAATGAASQRLAEGNRQYEARFGYIFIVCATGKSADEMLRILDERLCHNPDDELPVAAEEQRKITRLRLVKLLEED